MDSVVDDQAESHPFLGRQAQNPWPKYDGYRKLDRLRKEIRVLKIWFSPGTEDMHGRLEHVDLASSPQYEALSYYWGPPDEQRPIIINGETVLIAKNLHSFLAMLCSSAQGLPVWADALCINQADTEERNWQVSMMGDIYHHAARVKAWIGDADADSNFALDYVKYVSQSSPRLYKPPPTLENRVRQAFRVFVSRPYWERMWIIQETALASELVIISGSRLVRWDDLMAVLKEALGASRIPLEQKSALDPRKRKEYPRPNRFVEHLTRLDRLDAVGRLDRGSSLLHMVAQFVDHLCTDPRDKIYALLGIAERGAGHHLTVDYKKHVLGVYFDLLSTTLYSGRDLRELNHDTEAQQLTRDAVSVLEGFSRSPQDSDMSLFDILVNSTWRFPCYSLPVGNISRRESSGSDTGLGHGSDHPASAATQDATRAESLWNQISAERIRNIPVSMVDERGSKTEKFVPNTLRVQLRANDMVVERTVVAPPIVIRAKVPDVDFDIIGLLAPNRSESRARGPQNFKDPRRLLEVGKQICNHVELSSQGSISKIYIHVTGAALLLEMLGYESDGVVNSTMLPTLSSAAAKRYRTWGPYLCGCEDNRAEMRAEGKSAMHFLSMHAFWPKEWYETEEGLDDLYREWTSSEEPSAERLDDWLA